MSDLFASALAPKANAPDSRVHICRTCQRPGASCGLGDAWYCVPCAPADFWPHTRAAGA